MEKGIVERLRLYNGGYGFAAEQMKEAAAEIERLRTSVKAADLVIMQQHYEIERLRKAQERHLARSSG